MQADVRLVRDHNDRPPVVIHLLKDLHDLLALLAREIPRGLVGQDQAWIGGQGTSDGHALLLATGQLGRLVVHAVGQSYALERCQRALEAETPLRRIELSAAEERTLSGFGLLSRLPLLVLVNVAEAAVADPVAADVRTRLDAEAVPSLSLCAQIEMEIAALDAADRSAFLADLGVHESARDRFVQAAYALLDLISFLTTGEDEVRAWPIRRGTTAVKAAGKVHSDIERGFIRAEIYRPEDLKTFGTEAALKAQGKMRLEGKEYIVKDGDVVHFRAGT